MAGPAYGRRPPLAGDAVAIRVRWVYDPVLDRIVSSWPAAFDTRFGASLGMVADGDFESIVRSYRDEFHPAR